MSSTAVSGTLIPNVYTARVYRIIILFISDPLRQVYLESRLFKMVTDKVKEPQKTTPLQSEPGSRLNAHKFFT